MNVIVANEKRNALANLDVDIIKNVSGSYEAAEIVGMFKNFFYSRMILDVTAIRNYTDVHVYEVLASGLNPEKIIFLLPEGSSLCTPNFLSRLIALGIYNFTTNLNGIKYLLKTPNTLAKVESIQKMARVADSKESGASVAVVARQKITKGVTVCGFRNVTDQAGATTLIYMLKKELATIYGQENVVAVEVEKNDFQLFRDKNMISIKEAETKSVVQKFPNANIILVDLNTCKDDSFCSEVVFLVEPSTIKLNKLIRKNKEIFSQLSNAKVVLNKSLLLNNDVFDFEGEAGVKILYNLPPLDERKRNAIIHDFLVKIGLLNPDDTNSGNSTRIFGLFRR